DNLGMVMRIARCCDLLSVRLLVRINITLHKIDDARPQFVDFFRKGKIHSYLPAFLALQLAYRIGYAQRLLISRQGKREAPTSHIPSPCPYRLCPTPPTLYNV